MTSSNTTMGVFNWLILLVLSLLWGGSFLFAKIALAEVGPLSLVLARVTIAAVALGALLVLQGRGLPRGRSLWTSFIAMGIVNNLIPFSLLFWGQTQISGGLAAVLTATTPAFTVLVAHFATDDEKVTPGKTLGILLGLVGVAVLFGVEMSGGIVWLLAMAACLLASFSYAIAVVFGRRFRERGVEPMTVAFGQVASSALLMAPIAFLVESPWRYPVPAPVTVAAILGLGLLSTALAYVLFFKVLATAGATNISLVTLLIPVSAILLGYVFLDERLQPSHLAGVGLILSGLLAIDGRLQAGTRQLHRALQSARTSLFAGSSRDSNKDSQECKCHS